MQCDDLRAQHDAQKCCVFPGTCGQVEDIVYKMTSLLQHSKLFILERKGYTNSEEEEIALFRKKFEELGI